MAACEAREGGRRPRLPAAPARCRLGEHGRFRSPCRAGAGLSSDPARRTPPSAPPAGQPWRSPQAFPPAAPAPRHGEELELREPWLPASSSTAAQRGLPVQVTAARRASEGDEEGPGTRWTAPHLAGSGTGKLRRNSFPQAGNNFFLPLCGLEAGKEEVKTLRFFIGLTFCILAFLSAAEDASAHCIL